MYHKLANLFVKLSESTFYKAIRKFQYKIQIKSIRLAICEGFPYSSAHSSDCFFCLRAKN